jgi:methionine synthase II (cobalamin-independent)
MVEPTLSGNFPRNEKLIRATWNFDKGLIDKDTLRKAQHDASVQVVTLQDQLGCREATDGQFRWQDLMRPVAESTDGINVGGLVRFHETNTFLRRPILKEAFGPNALDAGAFLTYTATETWTRVARPKVVLPAPYFFLRTAEDQAFEGPEEAGEAVARVINRAAAAAVDKGAAVVQFNDPVLLHEKEPDIDLARRLLGITVKDLDAETVFYPYAGDAAPHWDELTAFPCHRLGVDFLATELDEVGELPTNKALLAGVVDSLTSIVEPEAVLSTFFGRLAPRMGGRNVQATHVYDLEFVPPAVAEQKIGALAAACRVPEVAQ